ncbi:MAG: ribonuclease P protein subunit [Thermoplasmata archaeon]
MKKKNKAVTGRTERQGIERKAANLPVHEFIGLEVEVIYSGLKQNRVKGVIVDETKSTLLLDCDGKAIRIPKQGAKIRIAMEGAIWEMELAKVLYRPHERPKKVKNPERIMKKVIEYGGNGYEQGSGTDTENCN